MRKKKKNPQYTCSGRHRLPCGCSFSYSGHRKDIPKADDHMEQRTKREVMCRQRKKAPVYFADQTFKKRGFNRR